MPDSFDAFLGRALADGRPHVLRRCAQRLRCSQASDVSAFRLVEALERLDAAAQLSLNRAAGGTHDSGGDDPGRGSGRAI